jgi:hypothetical protein
VAESDSVKRAAKPPISTHPAFPAIVALWFAALLGLGSMVLPIALFESLSTVTGVAALVPAAEPPLGFTARVVIALAGAFAGAAMGLLLARLVARSHAPRPRSLASAEARECRPISALDELGEEGLGSLGLAATDDEPGNAAVMPGAEAEPGFEEFGDRTESAEAHPWTQDQTMTEGQSFDPDPWNKAGEPEHGFAEAPAPQLSVVEPHRASRGSRLPLDDRPLEELGLVQLAGRLGAAIEKRRLLKAARPAPAPAQPASDVPTNIEAARPEDAARAIASFFAPGAAAAPLPPQDEEDDEDAFDRSFSLPLGGLARGHGLSPGEAIDEEDSLEEDETDEREYSSLLAMKNPFSRHEEFVPVDELEMEAGGFEPTAAFPATASAAFPEAPASSVWEQAAASAWPSDTLEESTDSADFPATPGISRGAAETDRDLRAALATLQRMNGAA